MLVRLDFDPVNTHALCAATSRADKTTAYCAAMHLLQASPQNTAGATDGGQLQARNAPLSVTTSSPLPPTAMLFGLTLQPPAPSFPVIGMV